MFPVAISSLPQTYNYHLKETFLVNLGISSIRSEWQHTTFSPTTQDEHLNASNLNDLIGEFLGRHATEDDRDACLCQFLVHKICISSLFSANVFDTILTSTKMSERPKRLDGLLRHLCVHTYAEVCDEKF